MKFKWQENSYKYLGGRDFLIYAGNNNLHISHVTDEDTIDSLLKVVKEKG